jgi:chemotaxis protein histidine kinase CheA
MKTFLLYLSDLVGLKSEMKMDSVYIVVVESERKKLGIIVNNLIGEQDIVIKALDEILQTNEGIAGASVLGDGSVALILDVNNLLKDTGKVNYTLGIPDLIPAEEKEKPVKLDDFYDNLNNS